MFCAKFQQFDLITYSRTSNSSALNFTNSNDEYLDILINISSFKVYWVRKFMYFVRIFDIIGFIRKTPKFNKPYQMSCRIPHSNLNTWARSRSLERLGVELHVPTVFNPLDHFELSPLGSPNYSFNCQNSDFSAICLHHDVQCLRNLQLRNLFPKILPHSTHCHHLPWICIQLPRSPSHDDQTPVSMISLARHVSNMLIDVINTLGMKPSKKLEWKMTILALVTFL